VICAAPGACAKRRTTLVPDIIRHKTKATQVSHIHGLAPSVTKHSVKDAGPGMKRSLLQENNLRLSAA
jgi:hypothetical protein